MDSKLKKILREYQTENSSKGVRKFKKVSIFPKIIQQHPVNYFSDQEKKQLTRAGFRWYVYYKFIDPVSGKYRKQNPIYLNINRAFPNFDDRHREIHLIKEGLLEALINGYNPYEKAAEEEVERLNHCLALALEIKRKEVNSPRTFQGYQTAVKKFIEWLNHNGYAMSDVKSCTQQMVVRFLSHIAAHASNKTRNNYKNNLSAVFSVLVQHELIASNFILNIKSIKESSKRDPTYSTKQMEHIHKELNRKASNKPLMLYIYFVSYMFWRPKENCRIKVKDINLEDCLITVQTKTKKNKTKRIPSILLEPLRNYIQYATPEDLLFTPRGPGKWTTQLDMRRNYFTKWYRRFKKQIGIPSEYNIYSFRHTFITRIYKNLRDEGLPKEKALEILSGITGHESNAIKAYIHYIDADATDDYSQYLRKKI